MFPHNLRTLISKKAYKAPTSPAPIRYTTKPSFQSPPIKHSFSQHNNEASSEYIRDSNSTNNIKHYPFKMPSEPIYQYNKEDSTLQNFDGKTFKTISLNTPIIFNLSALLSRTIAAGSVWSKVFSFRGVPPYYSTYQSWKSLKSNMTTKLNINHSIYKDVQGTIRAQNSKRRVLLTVAVSLGILFTIYSAQELSDPNFMLNKSASFFYT